MNKRIISYFILALAILFLPYWIYLPLLLAVIIIWPFYWEGLIFSLVIDFVYGRGLMLWPPRFSVTVIVLIILIIMLPIRSRLRIHV